MRRLLAAVVLIGATFFVVPIGTAAAAPKWETIAPVASLRVAAYTDPAPESFVEKVPSLVERFVGSSFDTTPDVGIYSKAAFANVNGFCDFGNGNQGSLLQPTFYTPTAGQDFALIISYAHYRDSNLGGGAGGSGAIYPRINGANVLAQTLPSISRAEVPGNDLGNPWAGYSFSYFGASNVMTAAVPGMPSGRYVSNRAFVTYSGKWNSSAGAWRVRTKVYQVMNGLSWGYSREATYSAAALQLYENVPLSGYRCELTHKSDGTLQVTADRTKDAIAANMEVLEAATTTDSAEVARVYDKAVGASALEGAPSVISDADPPVPGDDGSGPGLLSGWQDWVRSKVLDPINDAIGGMGDMLWFVDLAKEWFGVES